MRPPAGLALAAARALAIRLLAVLCLVAGLAGVGCRRAPEDELPAGTLWAGDARAARTLLASLRQVEATPIARLAGTLEHRLEGCARFLAHCPSGKTCDLAASLTCQPTGPLATLADEARGPAAWLFVAADAHRRLSAWGSPEGDGGWRVRARVRSDGEAPAPLWEALLPARSAAAKPVLSDGHVLLHLRLRSDRSLADLGKGAGAGKGADEWASELYGLRGELFAAMALEGTTELAVYESLPEQMIPPIALAIHVRRRDAAEKAIEALIAQTSQKWGATRRSWNVGPHRGACLTDLNVLPGLAPCYAVTDRALVLGWNPVAVVAALQERPSPGGESPGSLTLYLDRFADADARLRAAWRGEPTIRRYPWSLATLSGGKRNGGYELDLRLAPAAAPAPPRPAEQAR